MDLYFCPPCDRCICRRRFGMSPIISSGRRSTRMTCVSPLWTCPRCRSIGSYTWVCVHDVGYVQMMFGPSLDVDSRPGGAGASRPAAAVSVPYCGPPFRCCWHEHATSTMCLQSVVPAFSCAPSPERSALRIAQLVLRGPWPLTLASLRGTRSSRRSVMTGSSIWHTIPRCGSIFQDRARFHCPQERFTNALSCAPLPPQKCSSHRDPRNASSTTSFLIRFA